MGASAVREDRQRFGRELLALLAIGAALRVAAILTVGDVPRLHGDEGQYVAAARALARGEGYPDSFRPPAFPAFLASSFWLFGERLTAARLAQVPIALLTLALVFDIVRRRFGRRAAFLSGLFCAANPTLVHYTHFLWSETFVAAALVALVWCLDRFDASRREAWIAAAGVTLAVGALGRELLLYLAPGIAWWLCTGGVRGVRARARRVGLLVAALAAAILPWTIRNYAVQHRFVLISTSRWAPIAMGNLWSPDPTRSEQELRHEFRRQRGRLRDEIEREAFARDVALRAIREQQPWWIVRKLGSAPASLFSPASQLSRFAERGWLAPAWQRRAGVLIAFELVFYCALMVLGVTGLWLVPGGRLKSVVLLVLLFHVAVYTLSFATDRYRVPLLPLLALYAGPLACGHVASARRLGWRIAGASLCLAGFAVVVTTPAKPSLDGDDRAGAAARGAAGSAMRRDRRSDPMLGSRGASAGAAAADPVR